MSEATGETAAGVIGSGGAVPLPTGGRGPRRPRPQAASLGVALGLGGDAGLTLGDAAIGFFFVGEQVLLGCRIVEAQLPVLPA